MEGSCRTLGFSRRLVLNFSFISVSGIQSFGNPSTVISSFLKFACKRTCRKIAFCTFKFIVK